MNRKAIQSLDERTPALVEQGILTPESAGRLRAHFGPIPESNRLPIALIVCSVLGTTVIGLGAILVLAHNWDFLSRPQRTVPSFAPLVAGQGFGGGARVQRQSSDRWTIYCRYTD